MFERDVQSKSRYIKSFLIGTSIFIFIFIFSYFLAFFQLSKVTGDQGLTAYSLFEEKLSYTFFGDDLCSQEKIKSLSEKMSYQGRILEDLERKFSKSNPGVLERKKFYSVLLVEHLSFLKDYNINCNGEFEEIIFFYSNSKEFIDESEKLGRILDLVGAKNENVIIYSFDINLNSEVVRKLKDYYKVTEPNTIIIKDYKMVWPFSYNDVLEALND